MLRAFVAVVWVATSAISPAAAQDFYKGKTITLLVGSGEGSGWDQYARLLARHIGKYIAGEPAIVVKNQPAAGGIAMANALYTTAPRDGLTIGLMLRDNPLEPLLGNPAAKYSPERFTWLGTSSRFEDDAFCLAIRTDSGIAGIGDLQKPGRPAIFGGQAAGGSETDIVLIARAVFKLNLQFIRGYRSSSDTLLALRRGEIEGRGITVSALQRGMGDWLAAGKLRYLMQLGHETRWKGLPEVPTAHELATSEEDRALLALAEAPVQMSRPFVAPPGLPAEQAQILTRAFMAAHQDPDYLREAKEMQLDVSPMSGGEMQALMTRIAQTPPAVIARYKAALSAS
ncbi:MAG TPA: tripartite tricarboxylate transporter substrate-binding protein [Xanthobacteraceae bacterium]|jgi:tripartite-type tricarboxylate transporter receptor subunit TctC|nr:tripartite tricarboxylate transporter substrate-binding protein [Xanthobacteraceae bacterium]